MSSSRSKRCRFAATVSGYVFAANMPCTSSKATDVHAATPNERLDNPEENLSPTYNLSESEDSEGENNSDSNQPFDLRGNLAAWAVQFNISCNALNALLTILKASLLDVPADARTLLDTPRESDICPLAGGFYYHFGIKNSLLGAFNLARSKGLNKEFPTTVTLRINIDGIPLSKSSKSCLWPILGMVKQIPEVGVFIIGVYSGNSKPTSVQDYLNEFVNDLLSLMKNGIAFVEKQVEVTAPDAFICDAPARAFLKCIKGHSGYFGCERCIQRGEYHQHRIIFTELNSPQRTDIQFGNDEAHVGTSPLINLRIGMVTQFPLDYMHLVCLGVVRKLISLWIPGRSSRVLSSSIVNAVSAHLSSCTSFMPTEFSRKPRSLFYFRQWKATEFRQFLLYTGPVVLRSKLPPAIYQNFLTLSVAIRILLQGPDLQSCNYACELLKVFLEEVTQIYGKQTLVYNMHSLIHLAEDAKNYGSLDNVSCFPFESFLGQIKAMVRRPHNPVAQIVRRYTEKINCLSSKTLLTEKKDFILKQLHCNGPLPVSHSYCFQYKKLFGKFLISISKSDRCFTIKDEIVLVKNILATPDKEIFVVIQTFLRPEPFFEFPLNSKNLGIFVVSQNLSDLTVIPVSCLDKKAVLLPFNDHFVAIVLVHKDQGKFLLQKQAKN